MSADSNKAARQQYFSHGESLYINQPASIRHGERVTFSMYGPGSRDYDADIFLSDGRRVSIPSEWLSRENPRATAEEEV